MPLAGPSAGTGPGGRAIATLSGISHPIVAILLLISFFTAISGKPVDGLLMLIVAAGLAWDGAAQPTEDAEVPETAPAATDPVGAPPVHSGQRAAGLADGGRAGASRPAGPGLTGRGAAGRRRPAIVAAALACGVLYAVVVGSFPRYSWPATVAVIALSVIVVLIGWHGPVRHRPIPAELPLPGTVLWGGLLVAGGLWELSALLEQPNLTEDSYAHPTMSTLTDPLLNSHPGRSLALASWLVLGWLVIRR